jgi:hypothetical protein
MICDNYTNGTTSLGYHGEQALYVDDSSLEDLASNFIQAWFSLHDFSLAIHKHAFPPVPVQGWHDSCCLVQSVEL